MSAAPGLRSILCPVDFSDASRQALRHAAEMARRSEARLVVLFVNNPLFLAAAAAALHRRPRTLEQTEAELDDFVNAAVPAAARPRDMRRVVAQGVPVALILETAGRLDVDLIAIGTHGVRGLDRLFLGSTTEDVLRRAPVSVLAVPAAKNREATARVARVVVPIDPDGRWADVVNAAARVARLYGSTMALVHVVPRPQVPPWLRDETAAYDRKRMAAARRTLERIAMAVPAGIEVTSRAIIGNPADEIAAFAARGPATLVVMGARRESRARARSLTEQVVTHATAPVLAVAPV